MQGRLHAATIHVGGGGPRAWQPAVAAGEQQHRIAMLQPEAAQQLMGGLRQRHQAIPIAFGIAHVYACAHGIDIADLQAQPFTQTQAQAVERERRTPGN